MFQKREVRVTVKPFSLKGGEAIGNGLELLAHGIEIVQPFLQAQISEVVRAEFIAQEGGKLLVLFDERVFKVGAEYVMAVIDPFDRTVEFAAQSLCQALAENFGNPAAGHAPESHIAGAFEDLADREAVFEDEIAAVLNLSQGVKPAQVDAAAFSF